MTIMRGVSPNWLQSLIDKEFSEYGILASEVVELEASVDTAYWPRSLNCECRKCRSPFQEYVPVGTTIILRLKDDVVRTTYIPNKDKRLFEHI